MTSPLSPEAVAQMVADLDLFSRCGDVGVMDRDMAIDAKATLTTLAAENATMRAERDELAAAIDSIETSEGLTSNGNLWRFWAQKAREIASEFDTLRASEAAALEALAVMKAERDTARELAMQWSIQADALRSNVFNPSQPSPLTPTADKEPKA